MDVLAFGLGAVGCYFGVKLQTYAHEKGHYDALEKNNIPSKLSVRLLPNFIAKKFDKKYEKGMSGYCLVEDENKLIQLKDKEFKEVIGAGVKNSSKWASIVFAATIGLATFSSFQPVSDYLLYPALSFGVLFSSMSFSSSLVNGKHALKVYQNKYPSSDWNRIRAMDKHKEIYEKNPTLENELKYHVSKHVGDIDNPKVKNSFSRFEIEKNLAYLESVNGSGEVSKTIIEMKDHIPFRYDCNSSKHGEEFDAKKELFETYRSERLRSSAKDYLTETLTKDRNEFRYSVKKEPTFSKEKTISVQNTIDR